MFIELGWIDRDSTGENLTDDERKIKFANEVLSLKQLDHNLYAALQEIIRQEEEHKNK